jgi:hemolysin III
MEVVSRLVSIVVLRQAAQMRQSEIRKQSGNEEWLNCLSHGIGLVAALLLLPYLLAAAAHYGDWVTVTGARIFGISIILLYASSTIFHAVPDDRKRAKRIFKVIDHVSVYLLIAGTYTPFMLDPLRGPLGWSLFSLIWLLAILGTIFKFQGRLWKQRYSVAYYLFMGWLVLIALVPLANRLPIGVVLALITGGVLYSAGVYFYLSHHRRYAHFVWHLFVLAGTAAHIGAVFGMYAA